MPWRIFFQLKTSDIDSITSTYFDLYQTLYPPAVRTQGEKPAHKLAAYNPDNKQFTNLMNTKISRDKTVASTAAAGTIDPHGSTGNQSDDKQPESYKSMSSRISNTAGNELSAKSRLQLSLTEMVTTDNDTR